MSRVDIANLETALYGIPNDESLDDATQSFDELELIVVKLETSDGERGLGFTYTIGEGGAAIREFIETTLRPETEGAPAAPRPARDHLRAATTFVGREGISELAIAAIDIALWDALGRRLDAPLYEVLGGVERAVPAYETNGGWLQYDVETLVENAERAAADGFAGMKMKVGRGHAEDASRVRAVRETLSDRMELMVDANCSYTVADARRFARHVSEVPLAWLEEPLEKGDYAAHAQLREHVDVPIALGENLYNECQFKQALTTGAADVLQPDVCRVGGITPWLAVADAAQTWDLPVAPHYVEPLHVHLAVPFENVPYIEHHSTVLDTVIESPLTLRDGAFRPPSDSGHGIRFDGLAEFRK